MVDILLLKQLNSPPCVKAVTVFSIQLSLKSNLAIIKNLCVKEELNIFGFKLLSNNSLSQMSETIIIN